MILLLWIMWGMKIDLKTLVSTPIRWLIKNNSCSKYMAKPILYKIRLLTFKMNFTEINFKGWWTLYQYKRAMLSLFFEIYILNKSYFIICHTENPNPSAPCRFLLLYRVNSNVPIRILPMCIQNRCCPFEQIILW